jgi:hypothetical protein
VIDSGGFYITYFQTGTTVFVGTQTNAPLSRRNYEILDGSWAVYRENEIEEIMIRCQVSNPNYAGPAQPGAISGSATLCENSIEEYSISPVSAATSYTWNLPAGWNGTSNADTISVTTNATSGLISVTANGICGSSLPQTLNVTVNPLPVVGANATDNILCNGDPTTLTGSGAVSYAWTGSVTDGIAFTPGVTDTYTVTGTDINGCSNTANILITVHDLPTITASASEDTLCNGEQTILTGSGATSYAWTGSVTDGVSFAPGATDTYTVTGTDANGCSNTSSILVTVHSLPTIGANATDDILCNGESTTLTGSGGPSYVWSGGVTDGVAFIPGATDTYTVTSTDANGCSNTSSILITVHALPTIGANATDDILCNGESTTLTGSGGTSYAWSGSVVDGVAFTPGTTNTYTVTGTDVNACTNTDTITVVVNDLPIVTFTYPGNDTICINHGVQVLSGGSPVGGDYSGSGVTGTNFDPNTAGTGAHSITYTYTDLNGCANTSSEDIVVLGCSGIDPESGILVTVYPNPFTNTLTINGIEAGTQIELYNTWGEILESRLINETNPIIQTAHLTKGIYYLKITIGNESIVEKIIKQ